MRKRNRNKPTGLLKDPAFTREFLAGAEFEIYVHRDASNGRKFRDAYNFTKAREDILTLLESDHPEINWDGKLSFTTDGSLYSSSSTMPGVEMILAHESADTSLALIGKIIHSFSKSPWISTNNECGFHFNASFANHEHNTPDALMRVHAHAPIPEMLALFGRTRNTHCEDNSKTIIDSYRLFEEGNFYDVLAQPGKRKRSDRRSLTLAELTERISDLSKPKSLVQFQQLLLRHAFSIFACEWSDDRPACAPRLEYPEDYKLRPYKARKSNYCEFRMMGGLDYHKRPFDLAWGIERCLFALKAAHAESLIHNPKPPKLKATSVRR